MFKKRTMETISSEPKPEIGEPRRRMGPTRMTIIILVVVAALGLCGAWYFYSKYQATKADPTVEAQKQTETFLTAVGKLMELPQGETPTIATISDKEKLKDQAFFKTAENGDVLLAYTTAMTAILYRPTTNKIINVAPISINQPQNLAQGTQQGTPAPATVRIAYYNGTKTTGVSGLAEKAVKAKYPTWQTVSLTNASKHNYKETLVIDLSGKHAAQASDLASLLNGKVGSMPQGEATPNADILIISGE